MESKSVYMTIIDPLQPGVCSAAVHWHWVALKSSAGKVQEGLPGTATTAAASSQSLGLMSSWEQSAAAWLLT